MADAPLIGLDLRPGASTPLFEQVYETLRRRIIGGRIAAGSRLPASRSLAEELGVSRATIVAAYDQLIAEGFARARRGSGVYVSATGAVEIDPAPPPPPAVAAATGTPRPAALSPFLPGRPDMRLFPHRQWARCVARVARTAPEALIVAADPFGDPRLRMAIARYLAEWRGLAALPEQILITAGASDGLEICLRTLTSPGDPVALEDPGYRPLRRFVRDIGLRPAWLAITPDGPQLPDMDQPGRRPVLAILTPSSQFPLGGAMPTGRRIDFLKWAKATGGWILEDDYDSEFRYAGRPIPAMASFDTAGRTIYVGSFSKIFSETLRLGFLVVPRDLVARFAGALGPVGTKASLVPQRPLALFMENGDFYRHIRRMRRLYGERRQALIAGLRRELGNLVAFDDHQSGMQIALRLPEGADDVAIAERAERAGVVCPPLSAYYAGERKQAGLLVGFCGFTAEDMEQPLTTLRNVISDVLG